MVFPPTIPVRLEYRTIFLVGSIKADARLFCKAGD